MSATPTRNEVCPFCGGSIAPDEASRDHVFGEAFGGRLKVPCCRPCNSTIGHDIEGPLHAPDSLLAFARAAAGLAGKPLRGRYKDDGTRVNVHWTQGGAVPRDPKVEVSQEDGTITIRVGGTEDQVRNVWRGLQNRYGSAIPPVEEAFANAARTSGPSPWVEIALANELPMLHRFAAKVALSGGAAIWGDAFADADIANRLREILLAPDAEFDASEPRCDVGFLSMVSSVANQVAPVDLPDIALPHPGPAVVPTSQVVFAPIPRGKEATTAVFVTILNFSAPPYGILLSGSVPGKPTLPVVLREALGTKLVTWKLDEIFFGAIARLSEDR